MNRKYLALALAMLIAQSVFAQAAADERDSVPVLRIICSEPSIEVVKRIRPSVQRDRDGKPLFGTVVADVTISKTGEASEIKILKGDSRLRDSVVAALKQWRWKPFLLNGKPIEVVQKVTVNFEPR